VRQVCDVGFSALRRIGSVRQILGTVVECCRKEVMERAGEKVHSPHIKP
jgi:hypothetical protein